MNNKIKNITTLLIALLFILGGALPVTALEKAETRKVRVGFYRIEGYHVMDEFGNRSGYAYDVLQAMKLYNNWTYEYVGYDKGWADIQQMVLDGKVDLVISAVKTPERAEKFDFSDRPVSQSGACIMVKAGESPYVAGHYETYNGMRVGFIENAVQSASMELFAKEKGFTYTPVYYKTSDELSGAIRNGTEVDAIVTSNMRIIEGTRRLEMFAIQDVHAMVQKGNTELLAEVNYALEQINLYKTNFYDSLYNKYYSVDTGDEVFFSPDESEFLSECHKNGDVLRVAVTPDLSPYAYIDGDAPAGILYDIASEIVRRTGLKTRLVIAETDAEYRSLVENKGVDLRLAARFDYNYAEKLGYTLISPYYSTDVSRVTLKSYDGDIKSVAVVKNSLIETHYLPTVIKDETVLTFDSTEECVDAVRSGSCDALYLYTRTAQEEVFKDETNRLTSVVMPRFTVSFSIGVREDADARLASILEKASASLSEDDIAGIVLKHTDHPTKPVSLVGLLYSNPIFVIAIVALLLVILFAGIMIFFIARKRRLEREKNIQLQDALISAEQANLAKSVFMSRMSHEIRTPLNAIIGFNSISASALSEAKNAESYRHAAMKAMDCLSKSDIASKHLLTVINDVLDMSAIESGKIRIIHDSFDFKKMISSLTVMFFAQMKSKGIAFEVVFETVTEEWFIGDQMRISQILTNLLSNAVKFTSNGNIRLSVSQTNTEGNKARIHFEVSDTGIGMSEDFLSNMWKPFEQEDSSISRRFGGSGLGLSITKNLIDLMNGTISVESKVNVGSSFKVDITLDRTEQPSVSELDFSEISVLVVDDDRSTCDYLKLLIDRTGARSTTVTSGEEAVASVADKIKKNDQYTLCIIDWSMPGMDGLETIKKIRSIAGPDIPIIVISAYDFAEIEPSAKAVGVNSLIAKPLFQSTVFDLLSNLSEKHRVRPVERAERPDFGGACILLAEDNNMNREIAKSILTSWNISVIEAKDGQEAADLFCSAPAGTYKAILMDVHMPGTDGYRATQLIRGSTHAEAITIPIIAMTADVFAEDVAQALAAGMNAHIGKPIDTKLLLETLRKYCR